MFLEVDKPTGVAEDSPSYLEQSTAAGDQGSGRGGNWDPVVRRVLLEVDKSAGGTERKGLGQSRRRPTSLEAKEEGGDGESLPASVLSRVTAGMK
jgi:hypothetical protein